MANSPRFLLARTALRRPVAWRWELAGVLRHEDRGRGAADVREAGVRAAVEIQEAVEAPTPAGEAHALARTEPGVADAYAFWLSAEPDRVRRAQDAAAAGAGGAKFGPLAPAAMAVAELEALVLAGKSAEKIAKRVGLTPRAVEWYEAIWFDVRDRLGHPAWVASEVIGTLHQGSLGTLLPALVRAYGYFTRSARVVAHACSGFDARGARGAGVNPATFFAADAHAAGSLKAALAVRLMPLDDRRTYARVVELHQEATRISADAALAAGTEDENKLRDAVAHFSKTLRLSYGRAAPAEPQLLPPPPAAP